MVCVFCPVLGYKPTWYLIEFGEWNLLTRKQYPHVYLKNRFRRSSSEVFRETRSVGCSKSPKRFSSSPRSMLPSLRAKKCLKADSDLFGGGLRLLI